MNAQREVIYKRRKNAILGNRLKVDIANMLFDTCENITTENKISNDYKNFEFEIISNFSITSPIDESEFNDSEENEIINKLYDILSSNYQNKNKSSAEIAYQLLKMFLKKQITNLKELLSHSQTE